MNPEDVPDEVMRAFVNGASGSPPEVKGNSPEWVRNGLVRALAAYEATVLPEAEAQRQRAEQAEQALREEITAMAEERRLTGRANILNVVRDRDEQRARLQEAERRLDEALAAVQRVRDLVEAAKRDTTQLFARQFGGAPFPATLRADDVLAAVAPKETR